jgi:protein O-GlcNAc transferase
MDKLKEKTKSCLLPLIKNKNFEKIEELILSLNDDEKNNTFLLNLLGVSKLSKKSLNGEEAKKEALEAQNLFKIAYKKDNFFLDALFNYAETCLKTLVYEDVLELLTKHLKKVSYDFRTSFLLARINFQLGKVDAAINLYEKIIEKKDATPSVWKNLIFIFNYSSTYDQKKYINLCKQYIETIKETNTLSFNDNKKDKTSRKKRIGFFSVDLRQHAVSNFLTDTIKELNVNNFETIAFNLTNPNFEDSKTSELKSLFKEWHDIHALSDIDAVNLIRKSDIDILFDLVGYTGGSKLELFKNRSAPIQISWIGYTNTTGLDEMDYIIVDPYVLSSDKYYSEKLLQLPNIWSCHSTINEEIKITDLPALKNEYVSFGSFNNFSKISEQTIDIWSELLLNIKSKLILKTSNFQNEAGIDILMNRFKEKGIKLKNIEFLKRTKNYRDHLKSYNKIDIALDTFPYNGATTSFESLWMGVPVLTIEGETFNSRYGYSINKNLNLEKFIALDKEDFINKAKSNLSNLKDLNQLRKELRKKVVSSPLFDSYSFNKAFIKKINSLLKEK